MDKVTNLQVPQNEEVQLMNTHLLQKVCSMQQPTVRTSHPYSGRQFCLIAVRNLRVSVCVGRPG